MLSSLDEDIIRIFLQNVCSLSEFLNWNVFGFQLSFRSTRRWDISDANLKMKTSLTGDLSFVYVQTQSRRSFKDILQIFSMSLWHVAWNMNRFFLIWKHLSRRRSSSINKIAEFPRNFLYTYFFHLIFIHPRTLKNWWSRLDFHSMGKVFHFWFFMMFRNITSIKVGNVYFGKTNYYEN